MKHIGAALTVLLLLAGAVAAQNVSPLRTGITKGTDPEPVYVHDDSSNTWVTFGSISGGVFTPVAGGGGGGCTGTCDVNILSINGTGLGGPTAWGAAPVDGRNVIDVNANVLNQLTISALPLATNAATSSQQTTAQTTFTSILAAFSPLSTSALQTAGNTTLSSILSAFSPLATATNQSTQITALNLVNTNLGAILTKLSDGTQKSIVVCLDGTNACFGGGGTGGGGNTPQTLDSKAVNVAASTTAIVIPNLASNYTYITRETLVAAGTGNFTLEYGTGSLCATGTVVLEGPIPGVPQLGSNVGTGLGAIYKPIPIGNDVCLINAGGAAVTGALGYMQSTTLITGFGGGGGGGGGSGSNASVSANGGGAATSSTLNGIKDASGLQQAVSDTTPMPTKIMNTVTVANPSMAATGSAFPASQGAVGANASGNILPLVQTGASVPINVATATTTQLVAAVSLKLIYVTAWDMLSNGVTTVTFEYGTGSNCATGTTALTGPYGMVASLGATKGTGLGPVLVVPAGNALCVVNSAAVQVSGSLAYSQF